MSQKPNSHRKTVVGFVNDHALTSHIQGSPRINSANVEKRSPFTMNKNMSKTKFIEESTIIPEGPRAVTVTETGEKHYMPLEEVDVVQSPNLNALNLHGRNSVSISTNVSQSSAQKENNIKQVHMCRRVRRQLPQRGRLAFTPRRNAEKIASTDLLYNESKASLPLQGNALSRPMKTTSVQIQTDIQLPMTKCLPTIASNSYNAMLQKQFMQPSLPTPRRIYSVTEPKLKYFSELRGIISVVTLITVFSWLFSTFFEMELLSDLMGNVIQLFRSWRSTEEIPKTKAELIIEFLVNLWT